MNIRTNPYSELKSKLRFFSLSALLIVSSLTAAIVLTSNVPVVQAATYPFFDYFTMDANNPSPALQSGWSQFKTSSSTTTWALNSSLGILMSLKRTSGSGLVGFGEVTTSATSMSGNLGFSIGMTKPATTSLPIQVDYYLSPAKSTTAVPTCGSGKHWLHAYLDSAGYAKLDLCNGSVTNLYTSTSTGSVFAVWTLEFSGAFLSKAYVDLGSGDTVAYSTSTGLGFTSGYSYLIGTQSTTTAYTYSFLFFAETTADGIISSSIAKGLSYMSRAYFQIYTSSTSPNGNPMAVMRDLPTQPIEMTEANGAVHQLGEAWVTSSVFHCYYGSCLDQGDQLLYANSTFQSSLYTLYEYSGIGLPLGAVTLRVNVTAINTLAYKVQIKELQYVCSGTGRCPLTIYFSKYQAFSGNQVGVTWTTTQAHFGFMSNRYVGRHITSIFAGIASEFGYSTQATYLQNFLTYFLTSTYQDLYGPLFGTDTGYPYNWLITTNAFPDPNFAHALPTVASYPYAYPYKSRLTLPCAVNWQVLGSNGLDLPLGCGWTNGLYSELFAGNSLTTPFPNAKYSSPIADSMMALHLLNKYGTSNSSNVKAVGILLSGEYWNGNGVRLQMLWSPGYSCLYVIGCGVAPAIPLPPSGAYAGYNLGTFLGAVATAYHATSNSTYLTWANQAVNVILGTQVPQTAMVKGYSTSIALPDHVGGYASSYLPTGDPLYQFSTNQGILEGLTNELSSHGFFDQQPHETAGIAPTNTEASGADLAGLYLYNQYIGSSQSPISYGIANPTAGTMFTGIAATGQYGGVATGTNSWNGFQAASVNGSFAWAYPPGWFSSQGTSYATLGQRFQITPAATVVKPQFRVSTLLNASAKQYPQGGFGSYCLAPPPNCHSGKLSIYTYAKVYQGTIRGGLTVLGTRTSLLFSGQNTTRNFNQFNLTTIVFPSLTLSSGTTYTVEAGFNYTAWGTQQLNVNGLTQVQNVQLGPSIWTTHTDTSPSSWSTQNSPQKVFCYGNGGYFIFLVDGSTLGWVSAPALSGPWSSLHPITTSGNGGNPIYSSFTCSGGKVYYAIGNNPGTNGQDKIYYRYGTMNGNGTITWAISEGSFAGINAGAYTPYPTTAIATDGTWVMTFDEVVNSPTTYYEVQAVCVQPYSTCTWPQSTYDYSYGYSESTIVPTGGTGTAGYIKMSGLGSIGSSGTSQFYAVFNWNYNTGSTVHTYYLGAQNFVYSGAVGVIYGCAVNTASPYDVFFLKYSNPTLGTTSGSGTWTETDLGQTYGNSCAVSVQGNTIVVYFESTNNNANVWEIISRDGGATWGSAFTISTSENDGAFFVPLNGVEGNNFLNGVPAVVWSNLNANPETVRVEDG